MKRIDMNNLIARYTLGLLFILIGLSSCAPKGESNATDSFVNTEANNQLLHYWDDFDVADTAALNNPNVGEQAFVDFIAAFPSNSDTVVKRAIYSLFAKVTQNSLSQRYFIKQFEHYLYDANSPMRNDTYYQYVLEALLQSNSLDVADQYRFGERLKLVSKNQVGKQALDFKVELVDGAKTNIYDINSPFTLLFFYEPGCSHCEAAIEQFQNTAAFQNLVSQNTLKVMAVYAAGDRNTWNNYQSQIPTSWINGFDWDEQILSNAIYDLKASPTIYLLDQDKKVILKDTDLSQVVLFFNTNDL